jgi:SAM-dependent methyltransferase/uncharacterized protein YbaR (Trm112 family)
MDLPLLHVLRCPFCGGSLNAAKINQPAFDILTCDCGEYPVVAGIPIIKRGVIGTCRETADDVNRLIQVGQYRQALLSMIVPPPPAGPSLAPAWIQALPSLRGIRRLKHLAHQRVTPRWREQAAALLTDSGNEVTACDLLDLYCRRSAFQTNYDYDYFALRFAQPRYLVALSFSTLIRNPSRPVLDLACGFGHITRALLHRTERQPVIGLDHNFVGLYVAKKFIAPEAEFICSAADGPLPFPDGFFKAVFCSDAFHYFVNKATCISELKRLTQDDGLILLTWVHNALVRCPNDGLPLTPETYEGLVADMPHRLVADSEVLLRYRQKQGPPLARSAEIGRLSREALLSIVASPRQEVFRDYAAFEDWPHAEGNLGLNPLYTTKAYRRNGVEQIELRRRFPSAFYMEDHVQSKEYLPETVTVRSQVLADLAHGQRTPEVNRLIRQFLVLGLPERYQ